MILDAIIRAAVTLLNGVLSLLPTWSPPNWSALGGSLGGAMANANTLFPITTVGICITVVLGLQLFIFAWSGIVYVYKLIPFKAT